MVLCGRCNLRLLSDALSRPAPRRFVPRASRRATQGEQARPRTRPRDKTRHAARRVVTLSRSSRRPRCGRERAAAVLVARLSAAKNRPAATHAAPGSNLRAPVLGLTMDDDDLEAELMAVMEEQDSPPPAPAAPPPAKRSRQNEPPKVNPAPPVPPIVSSSNSMPSCSAADDDAPGYMW